MQAYLHIGLADATPWMRALHCHVGNERDVKSMTLGLLVVVVFTDAFTMFTKCLSRPFSQTQPFAKAFWVIFGPYLAPK